MPSRSCCSGVAKDDELSFFGSVVVVGLVSSSPRLSRSIGSSAVMVTVLVGIMVVAESGGGVLLEARGGRSGRQSMANLE